MDFLNIFKPEGIFLRHLPSDFYRKCTVARMCVLGSLGLHVAGVQAPLMFIHVRLLVLGSIFRSIMSRICLFLLVFSLIFSKIQKTHSEVVVSYTQVWQ